MSLPSLTLLSGTTNGAAPFCAGHAFKQGGVPAGSQVVAPFADFQCVPKNTWPDGSLKTAILSGKAALTANTPLPVALSIGTPTGGTNLTTADLKATGITAAIDCGAFGSVSWAATDWDTPFEAWVVGPKMTSWVYRKPVGSDPHLVAWLEVRLWLGGAVEVLPWIENGFFRVASPTNKSATYGFTLGGTSRFSTAIDLKHHQRTVLINGTMLAHWLGTDPGVSPMLDVAYLQSSELVPTYTGQATATGRSNLPTTFTPLQLGGFHYVDNGYGVDVMTNSGYQPCVGLLPEHDVMYMAGTDAPELRYAAVVRNGFSAGRFGIHYRDETTNRPPVFTTYPTLVFQDTEGHANTGDSTTGTKTPLPTGGNAPTWDTAHHPSVGYMAYLLTGRFYFKEETQFAVIANHFNVTDWVRGGGQVSGSTLATYTGGSGLCLAGQTRSRGWALRTLAQALAITPDAGDPFRASLINSVEENCRYYHQIYIAQTNNQFGIIEGGKGNYGNIAGKYTIPIWQQDFVTASWGYALCLGLPISSTASAKMSSFFQWKANSVVGRLGTSTGWWDINAAPYTMPVGSSTSIDFVGGTGPWLADFKAAYDLMAANYVDTYGTQPLGTVDNTLGMGFPESAAQGLSPSMWHNLHPAIAYAVRHGVAGAVAARNRLTSATNYSTIQATFDARPVWSVQPASTGVANVSFPQEPCWMLGDYNANQFTVSKYPGGIPKASVASGYTNKSIFENQLVGDPSNMEYTVESVSPPSSGTLIINENGSGSLTGATDGARFASFGIGKFGVLDGTQTIEFDVGVVVAPTVTLVTVSPLTPSIAGGATQQFSATVIGTNSPGQGVTWSRSGSAGSINSSGLFVAPVATTSAQTITITATSTVDGTKSGVATVTVPAIGAPVPTVTGVTVSPPSVSVSGGGTQQFTSAVSGLNSPSQAVIWSKTGPGAISSTGLFTAPAATSIAQTTTVTATSAADGSKSGIATVTTPAQAVSTTGRSLARTLICTDPQVAQDTSTGIGTAFNFATPTSPRGVKDPAATIDINFDWTPWLADSNDAYASHEIIVDGGLTVTYSDNISNLISAFVSGGDISSQTMASVTCRITTASVPPRTDDRTVFLRIQER